MNLIRKTCLLTSAARRDTMQLWSDFAMNEISYKNLNAKLLCDFFPEYKELICGIDSGLGENLPHCLYGNFFNPLIKSLLKNSTKANIEAAKKIFEFYEILAGSGDDEVKNLLQVTLLEYLWDDRSIYLSAVKYMGCNTKIINEEIGKYLLQPANNKSEHNIKTYAEKQKNAL